MMKKFIAILLACITLLALCTPAALAADTPYVRSSFAAYKGVTIDGQISEAEWGEPVIVTDKAHAQTTWGSSAYYAFEGAGTIVADQKVKVYMTNDKSYIYIGCTLDKSDFDTSCTAATKGALMNAAHLDFSIGKFTSATTVGNFTYGGQVNEIYTKFTLGWANGVPACVKSSNGSGYFRNLTASDYSLNYDDASRTYIYEVRVPIEYTPLRTTNGTGIPRDIAVSMNVGCDKLTSATGSSNRYNLTTGSANAGGGGVTSHLNNAMHMFLNDSWKHPTPYARTAFEEYRGVTLDGQITEAEWGEPVIVTNKAHAQSTWTASGYQAMEANPTTVTETPVLPVNLNQDLKVYLTNDTSSIYIGVTIDDTALDTSCTTATRTALTKAACVDFTIGKYNASTTIDTYLDGATTKERYAKYTVGFVNGVPTCVCSNQGVAYRNLTASEFKVSYDAALRTYTYEIRVPISATPLTPLSADDMVLSMTVGCAKLLTTSTSGSRYNLTMGAIRSPGASAHLNNAMHMTLSGSWSPLSPYVRTAFEPYTGVTIDGSITQAEWGEPVIHTTQAHTQSTWGAFYVYEAAGKSTFQSAKVYLTNDDDNIYIGVTLDDVDYDATCTTASRTALMKSAHIDFTLGMYDAATTMETFTDSGGVSHEKFAKYTIGLVNGVPTCICSHNPSATGIPYANLGTSDFTVVYDSVARTYTYEVRVPIANTAIQPLEGTDIAFSMNIGTAKLTAASANANRYNLTTGAANSNGTNGAHINKALHMTLNDVWQRATPYARDTFEPYNGVTIDGSITRAEWGDPVILTSQAHAQETWGNFNVTEAEYRSVHQTAQVYLTNDNNYIYIGVLLNDSEPDTTCTELTRGALMKSAHIDFTIGKYDAATTIDTYDEDGVTHEQYAKYTIGFVNGVPACICSHNPGATGIPYALLDESDYTVAYDATTRTYAYEVRVPFAYTALDPQITLDAAERTEIALSMNIGTAKQTSGSIHSNRYNLGMGASLSNGTNGAHLNEALHMTMNDEWSPVSPYVRTAFEPYKGVTIDGAITRAEWGEPVILTTQSHTQSTWGAFHTQEPTSKNAAQLLKVYMTNDSRYVYIGATLDESSLDTGCTTLTRTELMKYAHLDVTIGKYDPDTTIETYVDDEGVTHERFAKYTIGFVNGVPACVCSHNPDVSGLAYALLSDDDYTVEYDAATRTYTYEMRVPFNNTPLDPQTTTDDFTRTNLAISLNVGTTKQQSGSLYSNRYNLTTGAVNSAGTNMAHKNQALHMTINDEWEPVDAHVATSVAPYKGVTIDGYVTEGEWGTPIIVSTPVHCQATWGSFFKFDAAAVDPTQVAKIYATNDNKYVYFAATLDKSDFDKACTQANRLYNFAHFRLTLSAYDPDTTYARVRSLKQDWEQYACYMLGFVNGVPAIYDVSQKIDVTKLSDSDWAVRYDEATRTYLYEIRIPYSYAALCFGNNDQMAASFSIGCAFTTGAAANRYNFTTGQAKCSGAGNFAHHKNALVLGISANPYTGDFGALPIFLAVASTAAVATAVLCVKRRRIRRAVPDSEDA